jgi:hypothetical protein
MILKEKLTAVGNNRNITEAYQAVSIAEIPLSFHSEFLRPRQAVMRFQSISFRPFQCLSMMSLGSAR